MKIIAPASFLLAAVTLSCSGSHTSGTKPPTNQPGQLDVSIASVRLGDDCGGGPDNISPDELAPAPPPVEAKRAADEPAGSVQQGSSFAPSFGARACEQSSIQLRVANGTAAASKVAIEKVELLDDSGAVLRELTARVPSRWAGDTYQDWDQQVAPSETLQVSYALSAPSVARGATYTVRITFAAGDSERTLEQRATLEAEASLPPGAVT